MTRAEQLSLPNFNLPSNGPAAIVMMLRDTDTDNPKVLMSMRLRSGRLGFPGGKLWKSERRNPARGGMRETLAETGIRIFHPEYLIESHISPVRIAAEGRERDMHVFYCFAEECTRDDRPMRLEPRKHSSWRYVPVRMLPRYVAAGLLHPIATNADLLRVANEACDVAHQTKEFAAWFHRDQEIERELQEGTYSTLAYIHDKEAGHLVF